METANSVMKDIWMNAESASGQVITIERNYLYSLLLTLEKEQYNKGYDDGYEHRGLTQSKELPIEKNFEGLTVEW